MLNKILTIVLPIALPFLVYIGYIIITKRGGGNSGSQPSVAGMPWQWLGVAGIALMAAALISYRFVFSDPAGPGVTVVPNRYIDGEIQPYRIIEPDRPRDEETAGQGDKE